MLKKNDVLAACDMALNEMGPRAAKAIAEALQTNTSLLAFNIGLEVDEGAPTDPELRKAWRATKWYKRRGEDPNLELVADELKNLGVWAFGEKLDLEEDDPNQWAEKLVFPVGWRGNYAPDAFGGIGEGEMPTWCRCTGPHTPGGRPRPHFHPRPLDSQGPVIAKPTKNYARLEQEIIKTATRAAASVREKDWKKKKDETKSEYGTPKPRVVRQQAPSPSPCGHDHSHDANHAHSHHAHSHHAHSHHAHSHHAHGHNVHGHVPQQVPSPSASGHLHGFA